MQRYVPWSIPLFPNVTMKLDKTIMLLCIYVSIGHFLVKYRWTDSLNALNFYAKKLYTKIEVFSSLRFRCYWFMIVRRDIWFLMKGYRLSFSYISTIRFPINSTYSKISSLRQTSRFFLRIYIYTWNSFLLSFVFLFHAI